MPEQIIADGRQVLVNEMTPVIRAEVEREFAIRLASASWFRRWLLRRQMRREIQRRLDEVAPPNALY